MAQQEGCCTDSQWLALWEQGDICWQRTEPDKRLKKYIHLLTKGQPSVSIFVPLCGKSLDLVWLATQGHSVMGVELSPIAARQLFEENSLPYSATEGEQFTVFKAESIKLTIFVGSMFNLTPDLTGLCDAVWDCRSLVAVGVADRVNYIRIIRSILKPDGVVLLLSLEFNPIELIGPPYALSSDTVQALYGEGYSVKTLDSDDGNNVPALKNLKLSWINEVLEFIQPIQQ